MDGNAVDLLLRVVYCSMLSGFLIGGSVVCAMVTTHDSVSVVYDNNGLESRSDGGCPYGQNFSLRLLSYDIVGLRHFRFTPVVVVLFV